MHSDIRKIFIIAKRIQLALLFIFLIVSANYSFAINGNPTTACSGGHWAAAVSVSCDTRYQDCPSSITQYLSSYTYTSESGSSFSAPTFIQRTSATGYIVAISSVCLQSGDTEPEPNDDQDDDDCPDNQFWADSSGQCNDSDDCEIGNSMNSVTNACEPDDCNAGSYFNDSTSSCAPIPSSNPDPDPDPDGGGGGGSAPNCDSYSSCRDIALEELACKENDRDHFIYQYIGPDDYAAECETCDGPEYLLYDECQNGACDFGYDAQNNRCWTVACPHGDCIDPDADGAFDPNPLPTNQDNSDERLSEVITAINEVRDSIENNETPQKIEELKENLLTELDSNKTDIVNQLEENKSSNNSSMDTNTERLLSKLEQIEENTRDSIGNGDGTDPTSDKDYTQQLDDLLYNSDEILCQLNPKRAGCDPMSETTVNTNQGADSIMNGVQNSGIYSALSEFKDISINVTSACPSSFRFQLSFIGTYTIDVCAVFEPVVPLIRALFIAFWGLVSFRALTDA